MTSVDNALQLVLQNRKDFGEETVHLLQSVGRTLAQDVIADRDFPSYDRVTMDGIAIDSSRYNAGVRSYPVEKVHAAGRPQPTLINPDNCIEVMTGAILPLHTDVVIPYEQCEISNGVAVVRIAAVTPMQNVHKRGIDGKQNDLLVEKWQKVTPAMIGIMASVGMAKVEVVKIPRITICSTGDELVAVTEQPQLHQVRMSNVYMLAAALLKEGILAKTVHLPDNPATLASEISTLIKTNDVLLFSGAVSKGKFDYLPMVLSQLGMKELFHTVAQRPGKPLLFGTFETGTLIFGFPGNPVSTFVCYHYYFKQWLRQAMHQSMEKQFAQLSSDVVFKPSLTYHLLVQTRSENGVLVATPIFGSTSGDLVSLTKATCILTLPNDRDMFKEGDVFELSTII